MGFVSNTVAWLLIFDRLLGLIIITKEISSWMGCFGEVLSEITEERFDTEGLDPSLAPIGNGTYMVKIRLANDLPNWVPMYGKKICFD